MTCRHRSRKYRTSEPALLKKLLDRDRTGTIRFCTNMMSPGSRLRESDWRRGTARCDMSHPKIVIDANLLKNTSQGNVDAAEALLRYRRAGAEIYISRPAYEELVTRAPTPRFRAQYRTMLKELDIKIAPASAMKARVDLYADNIQTEPKASKGIGRFTEYGGKGNTEPGDVFVAGEAKSLNAQIFTLDETMVKRAKQFGVQLAPESTNIKAVRGPEDPTRGLDLLGIEEAEITITPMEINVSSRAATAVGLEAGGM